MSSHRRVGASAIFRLTLGITITSCAIDDKHAASAIDAEPADSALVIDAASNGCGDGQSVAGEFCYAPPVVLGAGSTSNDARFSDVDADQDLDAIVVGDALRIHAWTGAEFAGSSQNGTTERARYLAARDVNADRREEVLSVYQTQWIFWRNMAAPPYATAGSITVASQVAGGLVFANLDGTGAPEAVAVFSNQLSIGTIATAMPDTVAMSTLREVTFPAVDGPDGQALAAGAISDGDARDDIVVGGSRGVFVFRGAALDGVADRPTTASPTLAMNVGLGDFDGDGRPDIGILQSGRVALCRGLAGGAFAAEVTAPVLASSERAWDVADLDNDGYADLVVGVAGGLAVFRGNASATLANPAMIPLSAPVAVLHADRDANGDGLPDIIATRATEAIVLLSNP